MPTVFSLLLILSVVDKARSSCYVSRTSSIRREVLDVVVQPTFGCQWGCDANPACEATLLNAVGTHCVLLGPEIPDSSSNACPEPYIADVKTDCSTPLPPLTADPGLTSSTSVTSSTLSAESTSTAAPGISTSTVIDSVSTTTTVETTTTTATTTSTTGTTTTTVRVKGPIDDYYTVGECSRESDIVGSPSEGVSPPCGTPPLSQRRIVIDAIKEDGTHMVLENNLYSTIEWDSSKKSWYFEIESDSGMNTVYFYTAKCVLPPVDPLLPKCECAALNTEPAYSGNYNPVPAKIDTDPCCTKDYVQMNCVRAYSTAKTYSSGERLISCTMGEWLMLRTGSSHYNSYLIRAAACVD